MSRCWHTEISRCVEISIKGNVDSTIDGYEKTSRGRCVDFAKSREILDLEMSEGQNTEISMCQRFDMSKCEDEDMLICRNVSTLSDSNGIGNRKRIACLCLPLVSLQAFADYYLVNHEGDPLYLPVMTYHLLQAQVIQRFRKLM